MNRTFRWPAALALAFFILFTQSAPAQQPKAKKVTTVEGLGANGELHPVQKALIAEQAAQCGYCMSGISIAAAALLAANKRPTEAEVRQALDKNLCRCGSHNRVVKAVMRAARE